MVKSTKAHVSQDEAVLVDEHEEEDDYDDVVPRNNSSFSYRGTNNEQKPNTYRSKHSETEQRRRSKINEGFQLLKNLIPQNDERKDKASFLLERNHQGAAESFVDHSHDFKNGSVHENNGATHPILTTPQNSVESGLVTATAYKALDHPSGSTIPSDPIDIQAQSNMFTLNGRSATLCQTLQDSVSDIENLAYQSDSPLWQARPCIVQCVRNNMLNDQDMATEDGSATVSSAFSLGVLNTLTEVLRSSGVDLSQTSISVQIDVAKQANSGLMFETTSRDTEAIRK